MFTLVKCHYLFVLQFNLIKNIVAVSVYPKGVFVGKLNKINSRTRTWFCVYGK